MGYYALLSPTGTIVDETGYKLFGDARYGGNGENFYTPEFMIGNGTSSSSGQTVWDDDVSDGIDSGSVRIAMDANLQTGTGTYAVDGGTAPANFSFASGGSIDSVKIIAGAQVNGKVSWTDLSFTFYKNGVKQDTLAIPGTVGIDTTNSPTGVGEQICVVTPAASTDNRVVVTGKIHFQAAADVYPGADDLFGQILIMPKV